VLCHLIGRDVENGELPGDDKLLGPLIRNLCFANAQNYLAGPGVGGGRGER
jgi:glucuronate isomerase